MEVSVQLHAPNEMPMACDVPKWGMAITNQIFIHKETDSRLNVGSICFHSVQNLVFQSLILPSS
jgi:hypothetical protein